MKTFCLNCMDFEDFTTTKATIDNIDFQYNEITAYCKECNNEVYVQLIEEVNLARRLKALWNCG